MLVSAGVTWAEAPTSEQDLIDLVARMNVQEKIGQLNLRGRGSTGSTAEIPAELIAAVRAGQVGALINIMLPEEVDRLQRLAVEESPHGIPLLFGRDVIHGLHAVAPIPLAQAATWNPDLVEAGARAAAIDARAYGINWTFAPMVDIARDPRWGRIAESLGEDPFLASRMGEAMVRGWHGSSLQDPTSVAACVKHFAAYGAAEGGRDYNTVSMPETELRNIYLPPFQAAIEAGALSVMSSFNEINGIPATANRQLLTEILREEWGFEGFVVSDWNSVGEMIAHGFSVDEQDAARQSVEAGLDMEMMSTTFEDHLPQLVSAGSVSEDSLDQAVLRILRVKQRLGLFERPYRDPDAEPGLLREDSVQVARQLALESAVLLRNTGSILPLSMEVGRVAIIGPLADAPHEQLGTWSFDSRAEDSVTPLAALRDRLGPERVSFARGLEHSRSSSREGFADAKAAAASSDVVLFFGGEEAILSGEAHSRADIRLPGAQQDLIRELAASGKPVVLVILAGRPLVLHEILTDVAAVLYAWHPGTEAGPALADLLLGIDSPMGRLPVTWPKGVGQIPIYYNHKNTGRPPQSERMIDLEDIPVGAWQSSLGNTSHYLDLGMEPEFPFGFGLTYARFSYSDVEVEPRRLQPGQAVRISATVTNTGDTPAVETVQLYVRDLVGTRTRPVRELEGFQRHEVAAGASVRVKFTLETQDLAFFDGVDWVTEPGEFEVWVAPNATSGESGSFVLLEVEPR
jgi:beta-glucosidase